MIHQEHTFSAPPARIYEALMDSDQHSAFTGGPAKISGEAGGAFTCHGGQIVGRNIELVPGKRIVQAWRVAAWPEGVYTVVRFELVPEGAGTKLVMDHAGVAPEATEMIASGWKMRYWEPLTKYLA